MKKKDIKDLLADLDFVTWQEVEEIDGIERPVLVKYIIIGPKALLQDGKRVVEILAGEGIQPQREPGERTTIQGGKEP